MARPTVLVTRPAPEEALALLRPRAELVVLDGGEERPIPTEDELLAAIPPADVVFGMPAHPYTARVLGAAARLKLLATMGTGYDNVDLAAARARGIRVTNAPGILDETTADLAFALLLAAARRIPEAERFLRDGRWRGWTPFQFAGVDVHGKVLGIVGLGRIGRAVARRARGFGMRILYSGPTRKPDAEAEGLEPRSLDALLAESDFVSVHAPLTPQTRGLLGADAFARMKPTAVLVNTSRGPLVDEAALARALREGRIAAAGLDVYEREPSVHPELLECPNAVLLPHIGSASKETRRRMAERAARNILAFLDGAPLLDPVA